MDKEQLKAVRKRPKALQRGKKGGIFYVADGGSKVYTHELPKEREPAAPKPEKAAGRASKRTTAQPKGKGPGNFRKESTTPVARVVGPDGRQRPAGAAGQQLPPQTLERLKALGVSKLPAAHIEHIEVSHHLHDDDHAHRGALIKWKDDKGRTQSAYSEQHDRQQAEKKWERVTRNRPKVEKAIEDMKQQAQTSPAHAATLLMEQTSLRPGSTHSVKAEGHYGATTLEGRHLRFEGDAAHLEFVGKQGKLNKATVTDPDLVSALRRHAEGKGPNDRIFDVSAAEVRAAAPKGVKLKDFRTIGATRHAEAELDRAGKPILTGNIKQDARTVAGVLKSVSERVSGRLNNTPAMARKSYIAPQAVAAWAKKHGIPQEIIKWP